VLADFADYYLGNSVAEQAEAVDVYVQSIEFHLYNVADYCCVGHCTTQQEATAEIESFVLSSVFPRTVNTYLQIDCIVNLIN
jgi:hypothetical protein